MASNKSDAEAINISGSLRMQSYRLLTEMERSPDTVEQNLVRYQRSLNAEALLSVQNQLLKQRFELEGYTPNIIMRGSQIYTTLQFLKMNKYGCFLYSSMTDKFSNIVGIPLNPPIQVKIGMIWKKGKYIRNDMQTFLNFTKKYYIEHPLTGN